VGKRSGRRVACPGSCQGGSQGGLTAFRRAVAKAAKEGGELHQRPSFPPPVSDFPEICDGPIEHLAKPRGLR
jgi:hypothetical protein